MTLFLLLLSFFRAYAGGIDINSADATTLATLPGIGESKAAAIIQYRTENGPFKTVDELDNVSGIGPSTLASIRDLVSIGAGTPAAPQSGTSAAAPTPAPAGSTAAGCPVNINSADLAGLKNLPGIGDSKATAIIQYRTDNGPFPSCDALDNVSGIGAATLSSIAPCCVVK